MNILIVTCLVLFVLVLLIEGGAYIKHNLQLQNICNIAMAVIIVAFVLGSVVCLVFNL